MLAYTKLTYKFAEVFYFGNSSAKRNEISQLRLLQYMGSQKLDMTYLVTEQQTRAAVST